MSRQGIRVTGVDITASYLDELKAKAKRRNLKIPVMREDMRNISFANQFDAAGNLWTSFGYFEKESDNLRTLKRLYQAIKPGGRAVIQTINRDWIIRNFQESDWQEIRGIKLLESRKFDLETSTIKSTWTFISDKPPLSIDVNIRIYSYHELTNLFRKAGFVSIEGYADESGAPVEFKSRDMFVFGTKPRK
jgi:SAM-dependent methyltransferase